MRRNMFFGLAALLAAGVAPTSLYAASAAAFGDPSDGAILNPTTHPRAHPMALGFGKDAVVRAGNAVVYVINSLADVVNPTDTAVTFRECVQAEPINTAAHAVITAGKPRYCIFKRGGQIKLKSPLTATVPKLFIAGQTAPNDGVEITIDVANYEPSPTEISAILSINTTDVVVQHLRVRGDNHAARPSDNLDSIIILGGADRVVIDHVSMGYTTDEVFNAYGGKNITVSNSIIGPMLCSSSGSPANGLLVGHQEPNHCRPNFTNGSKNVTFYNNYIAYGEMRWANVAAGARDPITTNALPGEWGQIDIVNNLGYYFRIEAGLVGNNTGHTFANYIGNTVWQGPRAPLATTYPIILWNKDTSGSPAFGGRDITGFRVYVSGNRWWRTTEVTLDPGSTWTYCGITNTNPPAVDCSVTGLAVVSTSVPAIDPNNLGLSIANADIQTAAGAEQMILYYAGANRCRNPASTLGGMGCRNEIDAAMIADYQTCNTSPLFPTSWPTTRLNAFGDDTFNTTALTGADTDKDGMPDAWETAKGLNPNTYNPNNDPDDDGYANIEEFIASYAAVASWYNIQRVGPPAAQAVPPANCGNPINP